MRRRLDHEAKLGRGAQADDLEDAVVGLGHGRDLHPAAEEAAVADGEVPGDDPLLPGLAGEAQRALEHADFALDQPLERGAQVGERPSELAARLGDELVDHPAHPDREDVDEEGGHRGAVVPTERGPPDVDAPGLAAGDGGAVPVEAVLDAEGAAEVAAGALPDDAEARHRAARSRAPP